MSIEEWLEEQGFSYDATEGRWESMALTDDGVEVVIFCTTEQAEEFRTHGPTQGLH